MPYMDESQIRDEYRRRMGEPLGQLFSALWHELVWLRIKWNEYVELFGTSPERIDLLNRVAPNFFGIIQDIMLNDISLHVARMTDAPKSAGKETLTIRALPDQVDPEIKSHIESLIKAAGHQVEVCRDSRNRRIAHSELALALEYPSAVPLPAVSRAQIRQGLQSIGSVLNAVEEHYGCSTTGFEHTIPALGGAGSLFDIIQAALISGNEIAGKETG